MNGAKIITVINYKGGVGKTTSAFNIAVCLRKIYEYFNNKIDIKYEAQVRKALKQFHSLFREGEWTIDEMEDSLKDQFKTGKILVIDLDPQSSISKLCLKNVRDGDSITEIKLEEISKTETVNFIFKSYLYSKELGITPTFNLKKLIKKNKYKIDFIPSTMFYHENGFDKGLDNLEIEISRSNSDHLFNLTMLSKFFFDNKIDEKYDFVLFDCPPANNIITQNALVMSNHYLIPTIMDDMSANGIPHLHNLIQKTIIGYIQDNYSEFIKENSTGCYLKYLNNSTDLIGIFETLKETNVKHSNNEIRKALSEKFEVFNEIVHEYNSISNGLQNGAACIDIDFSKVKNNGAISYHVIACEVLFNYS